MTANACTGEEGLNGVGVFNRGTGSFAGPASGSWVGPPLGLLRPCMVGRSLQQPPLVKRDAEFPFPPHELWDSPLLWLTLVYRASWDISDSRVSGLQSSSFSGRATPWNTSSSEKERYHFTSSLNSFMLLASRCGSPPVGGLTSSTQCWRVLAYATAFSQGISLISLHA